MSWKQFAQKVNTPFLQSLRENSVISIGKSVINDFPGFFLLHMLLVNQNTQEFDYTQSRVSIIELNAGFFR